MKKVFLTLALVAFAFAANAQFVIGGQLGFNTNGSKYTQESANPVWDSPVAKAMNLTIAPSVGYMLNDNMQVGLSLEYTLTNTTNYNRAVYALGQEEWAKTSNSVFTIAPYFRYYFAQAGDFNFFCEATLGYGIMGRGNNHDYSNVPGLSYDNEYKGVNSMNVLMFTIIPGVNYRFSENFSADCYIDLAGLAFYNITTKTYGVGADPDALFSTDVNNVFGLVANTSAQDLNAHLGNFRIGFNYHF